ncbi:hypothetical protein [Caballeronia sp. Sq4a]|uniref:hypothetical protein n=1 Tax=Caballeronia sp. Sq4a TaxID=2878152 RepID=UPI0020C0987B|nr:hypothetical protein [Caballeronia sp. Sq4a]
MADYSHMAFLDILGYKNYLDTDIKNGTQVFREKMIAAFRVFDGVNQANFSHKAISDSIFISCSDRTAAPELICVLRDVFASFLGQGLLIRGGVSYGEHFQNQTITYSPVLTKAYTLESAVADFPRIMIDRNIADMFPALGSDRTILRTGEYWYLNVVTPENYEALWISARATFESNIEEISKNEKVRIKHRWLQDYLIEVGEIMGLSRKHRYLKTFDVGP